MWKSTLAILALMVGGTAAWAEKPAEPAERTSQPRPRFATLHFAFDSSELDPASESGLAAAKAWLDEHPGSYLLIEAHTDAIGTDAYNAGLATRRGESVRTELLRLGADSARLVVGIYGERQPMTSANPANRRAVVRGTDETLDQIIARTFVDGMAVVWSYVASPEVVAQRDLGRPRDSG